MMTKRARLTSLAAAGVLAGGALTAVAVAPAQAAPGAVAPAQSAPGAVAPAQSAPGAPGGKAGPAAWTPTTSLGGPIRSCYAASCGVVIGTYSGEALHWSHYEYNSSGNRWYYVRDSIGTTGWIYCGNVTAPC
ncbi:hypothetical protein [Streptomyces sp. NPDC059209]|uniref:hypothetical protein n=1 Tax=Streptomyces sp. NPDC059209 TaxID=3346769 RepID=UPI003691CD31